MDARVLEAQVEFYHRPFRTPLILSTGPITEITEARAKVRVSVEGKEAVGQGSMYLSDLWAWPDPALSHAERDAALRSLCEEMAAKLPELCSEAAHPLELGLRLHDHFCHEATPPVLARAMCLSPFDAAIHDAVGIALGISAFDFYSEDVELPTADKYFRNDARAAIAKTIHKPVKELPAWLIVGKNDDLEKDVAPWVKDRGYKHFKLKIMGQDNTVDVARTIQVFRAVKEFGVSDPALTIDSNEANPNAASVLDYLERLKSEDADAFNALSYVEQPTGRDITEYPNDWREVTKLKPVLLDEGLTSLDVMQEAVAQGWSGFALKTCKGHSFALAAAAWAKDNGMLLALQDLTNPGLAAIHAALFAAHIPMLNGVELNSPQFTPAANSEWLPRLSGLLDPQDGLHHLPQYTPVGLGSTL